MLVLPQKVRSGSDSIGCGRSGDKAGPLPLPTVCSPLYVAFALVDSVEVDDEAFPQIG